MPVALPTVLEKCASTCFLRLAAVALMWSCDAARFHLDSRGPAADSILLHPKQISRHESVSKRHVDLHFQQKGPRPGKLGAKRSLLLEGRLKYVLH
jgi:hypothetical protein